MYIAMTTTYLHVLQMYIAMTTTYLHVLYCHACNVPSLATDSNNLDINGFHK